MTLRHSLTAALILPAALAISACDTKPAEPAAATPTSAPADSPGPGARPDGPMTLTAMQVRSDERFRAADSDGDGVISSAELETLAQAGPGGGRDGRGGGRGLARADADGDGRITLEEARAQVAERFARMDSNGDGAITDDERPQRGDWGGGRGRDGRDGPAPQ
ncbi:EF-hand domain-containing protein [Brevundimonas sp.]|uniref:EF-hand domain-containing protein n=1 Tax=Brevundimonas sp. TaxID=1871086 RepID=UPI003BAC329A